MNVLVDEAKVLLTVTLLLELTILLDSSLTELELSISLGSGIQSNAKILADQTYLESVRVVSASGNIFKNTWARVVCVNTPASACAHRQDV